MVKMDWEVMVILHLMKIILNNNAMKHMPDKLSLFGLFILIVACRPEIHYPDGGYTYPKNVTAKDTNLYYYPTQGMVSKKDAFGLYYISYLYRRYDEPNLSLKPQPADVFRLTYSTAFNDDVIITINDRTITIKQGGPDSLYVMDTSRLNTIENFHLRILDRWYPLDEAGKRPVAKRYLDSLIQVYPQLIDPDYYHKIYEKQFTTTGRRSKYSTFEVMLSKEQYDSLIQEINKSGFWSLPPMHRCTEDIADGILFTLEANTKYKYQVVSMEGCPNNDNKYTLVCQKLIRLAKMDNEVHLIWKSL